MNQDVVNVVESLGGTVLFGGALIQFTDTTFMDALKKIYESGVLAEREACLKIAESMSLTDANMNKTWRTGCRDVAEAIRARGQA